MASWIWEVVPFAAMLTLDFTDAGVYIINKAALVEGMSEFVSVVYSNALGTIILLPYFIFHRRRRAPLTFPLLCRFFLLALIGSTGQILSSIGIKLSSPTLLSAMANLIPIFTFLLAVIFRMEALDLRRSTSQAKSLGAVLSVAGAFLVTLYKGPAIWMTSTSGSHHQLLLLSKQSDWILGGFLFLIVSILAAGWTILQGATVKEYPEGMTIVFFFTFFVTIQAAVFAVIFEGDPYAWRIKPGTELIFIVCSYLGV
ncbi:hypothetical protein K2173_020026 [Erythroxylum novogranatense]|uniref:WAT1-related protein n=1 Tax=Erythroxylum novogranatense TaxID=1862640 RepID=A0AAV8U6S0_9ROSI|nr:hypothetical protein K2173_020026 [Erythroxylum novogranatense]